MTDQKQTSDEHKKEKESKDKKPPLIVIKGKELDGIDVFNIVLFGCIFF